jgi:acetamidase/formamidase
MIAICVCLANPSEGQSGRHDKPDKKDERAIRHPDHFVPSSPENVTWGEFPSDRQPVRVVQSGETVRIDTISQRGATQAENPELYLARFGIKRSEILRDVLDFRYSRPSRPRPGRGGHILTGPIYIEGAAPGDTLEIQILDLSIKGVKATEPRR